MTGSLLALGLILSVACRPKPSGLDGTTDTGPGTCTVDDTGGTSTDTTGDGGTPRTDGGTPTGDGGSTKDSGSTGDGGTFGEDETCVWSDGWKKSVLALEAEFQATGRCPEGVPAEVAMLDGTMYKPDPLVLDSGADGGYSWGFIMSGPEWAYTPGAAGYIYLLVKSESDDLGCYEGHSTDGDMSAGDAIPASSTMVYVRYNVENGQPLTFPYFISSAVKDNDDGYLGVAGYFGLPGGKERAQAYVTSDPAAELPCSYAWVCINSLRPNSTEAFYGSPGTWDGAVFLHTEAWTNAGSTYGAPRDIFLSLGAINCQNVEDANWESEESYLVNWSSDCDGYDNDFDGVIDEGRYSTYYPLDDDGNGAPDCQDDWDDDGIPNYRDEDIRECCIVRDRTPVRPASPM